MAFLCSENTASKIMSCDEHFVVGVTLSARVKVFQMCKNLNLSKSTPLIQGTMDNQVMLRVGTVVFPREDFPVDYAMSGGQP